jgi:hypothetical protein
MNLEREDIELGNTVDEKSGCGLWGCRINWKEIVDFA